MLDIHSYDCCWVYVFLCLCTPGEAMRCPQPMPLSPPQCNVTSGQGWLAGPSILSACKVVSSSVTGLVRQAVITPESRYSKVCQVIEDIKDTDRGHLNWLSHRIEVFDERWSEPTLSNILQQTKEIMYHLSTAALVYVPGSMNTLSQKHFRYPL